MRAKLHAWWEGVDVPGEETFELAVLEEQEEPPPELTPRFTALYRLWGGWRANPQEAGRDAAMLDALDLSPADPICVLGPGGIAPIKDLLALRAGAIEAFEWRDEGYSALRSYASQIPGRPVPVHPLKLDGAGMKGRFAGLLSYDELGYTPALERFIAATLEPLRVGAAAVFEGYCTEDPLLETGSAFATAFAVPVLRSSEDVRLAFELLGAKVESVEDRTQAHILAVRAAFQNFSERTQAGLQPLQPGVARELAWEAESWRVRLMLLSAGKLKRMRFVVRKPHETARMKKLSFFRMLTGPTRGA